MTATNWKTVRPNSITHALRLCKDYAAARRNLSVEQIADRMGATVESLYKWLASGRMPLIVVPAYELACGCHYASTCLAATAGKLVVDMPKGRRTTPADLVDMNSGWAAAMQLLNGFFADPAAADKEATLAALRAHLEQVAYHHQNVAQYESPQLEF